MLNENSNKIKLLKIMELLRLETDEDNPISRKELCNRITSEGIKCDIRTLSRDIKVLNQYGFEIMTNMIGHEKYYYVVDRVFEVPELRILIDSVQAASFITPKKTKLLISKIASLGGKNQASIIKDNLVYFNTRKHTNENIFYSVDALEKAILQNKKIRFQYFDLDERGNRIYRKDGEYYITEPIALVFNEDNYYLVAFSNKYNATTNYRVDRMNFVELVDEIICEQTIQLRHSISGITESAFKMFSGEMADVTLQFDKSIIGPIFDKFGEKTCIKIISEMKCETTVSVQKSPVFYGWVFQFGSKIKIMSPDDCIKEFNELKKA